MKKAILTTGGTGGHIFPALAVAQALKRNYPGIDILFIGSTQGYESEMVPKAGLDFIALPGGGLMGRGLKAIPAAWNLANSVIRALKIIKNFHPDIVAGFGGYASFAPVFAAALMRKKIILHEQNSVAGSANKFLEKFSSAICASWPETQGFSSNLALTGNPVRHEFTQAPKEKKDFSAKRLLVLGGSQGAHAINSFVIDHLETFKKAGIEIWHQTGVRDLEKAREAYAKAGYEKCRVDAFIEDMPSAYAWAALALCRSGAGTAAELCAMGLPAVFIPFPAAIHNHQALNAAFLVKANAALCVEEDCLEKANVVQTICNLLNDRHALFEMSRQALRIARPEAADDIVKIMEKSLQN